MTIDSFQLGLGIAAGLAWVAIFTVAVYSIVTGIKWVIENREAIGVWRRWMLRRQRKPQWTYLQGEPLKDRPFEERVADSIIDRLKERDIL